MRAERYILKTEIGGKTQEIVWDTSKPLGIGFPFRWIFENTPSGIRVRNLTRPETGAQSPSSIRIESEQILSGETISLPPYRVRLRKVGKPPAPYLSNAYVPGKNSPLQLFAYSGILRSINDCQAVHSAYVGYTRGKPVFTAYQTSEGLQVRALLDSVYVKLKGGKPLPIESGEKVLLTREKLGSATLVRGRYWWKFNLVKQPESLDLGALELSFDTDDTAWFKRTFRYCAAIALLICGVLMLVKHPEKGAEIKPEPPIVRFKPLNRSKSKLPIQSTEKSTTLQSSESAKKSEKPSTTEMPAAKASAAASPRKSTTAGVPNKPVTAAQSEAQARRQAQQVREALMGAKALTESSNVASVSGNPSGGSATLESKAGPSELNPAQIRPAYSGSGKKVSAIGNGRSSNAVGAVNGQEIGYGSGKVISLSGQGGSLVSMDGKGLNVQEGLTKEEVGAVIHSHMSEVRYCHESILLTDPRVEGKLVLEFTIDAAGRVKTVSPQSSTLKGPALSDCVIRRLYTWQFPKPIGGVHVTVSYPFLFKTLRKE